MTSRNPFEEIERMFEQMDKGLRSFDANLTQGIPLDLVDEGDTYHITADLPGYEKDDIEVRLSRSTLQISAERDVETESSDGEFVRRERSRESVSRSVRLPEAVVEDETDASYQNGVLTITLSKESHGDDGKSISIE
ncbi:Hsp20/alpha crystallin family protein [Halocatena pleomorpha]|uniref:Hsp20/alpha crystallin family protein n=1 Tax=Halocatena pleomorpha TaxID=1785090 RepID=A0A3P3R4D8_9EURY|nr:Hsp20/alpha crystallin family protein [Halocatena pleomorpha]RRJ28332.1 Hsp20/alpha crystallin family protein [Halocatena pleomorpha]